MGGVVNKVGVIPTILRRPTVCKVSPPPNLVPYRMNCRVLQFPRPIATTALGAACQVLRVCCPPESVYSLKTLTHNSLKACKGAICYLPMASYR